MIYNVIKGKKLTKGASFIWCVWPQRQTVQAFAWHMIKLIRTTSAKFQSLWLGPAASSGGWTRSMRKVMASWRLQKGVSFYLFCFLICVVFFLFFCSHFFCMCVCFFFFKSTRRECHTTRFNTWGSGTHPLDTALQVLSLQANRTGSFSADFWRCQQRK